MKRAILGAAFGALVMTAATGAWSEDGQMRVALGDLNLATSDGARVALARIQFGADEFCDANAGRQPLERTARVQRCVADMTRKSVQQLHAPLVTALIEGRAAQPAPVALAQK